MGNTMYQSIHEELNVLREENAKLRLEHNEYKTIFMIAKNGIALLDLESNFLSVNPAYLEMSGYTEEELFQTSCIKLSIKEDIPRSIAIIKEVIEVGYVKNYEKTCVLKDGKHVTVNMSLALLPDNKTILINTMDVTETRALQIELYRQKEKFKKQAYFDMLTELPNRVAFNYHLKKTIENAALEEEKFALMYLDLNKFKAINDTYGHAVGDEVLKVSAKNINKLINPNDFFARIGGDEFSVIIKDINRAKVLAEEVIETLKNIEQVDDFSINISTSIGITIYPDNATNCKDLLISADMAMYEAKYSEDISISFA